MQAMIINRFGASAEFEHMQLPKPKLKSGQVLIKVKATSVNPLDYKLRQGMMPALINHFPMVLHGDVSGIVEDVAVNVINFQPGDEIYGCIGGLLHMQGALAEYVAADADLISLKPKSLSFAEAAALPLVAETCWEALVTKVNIQPEQNILIYGGTGGVGHFALQLAKLKGANVFVTVADASKAQIAKQLGADQVINYKQQAVEQYVATCTQGVGFDIVFDTVGGDNLSTAMQAVKSSGSVVTIMPHGQYDLTNLFLKNANLFCVMQPLPLITGMGRAGYGEILTQLTQYMDAGQIKPLIDPKKFNFEQVGLAHDHLASGRAIGKVVLNNEW